MAGAAAKRFPPQVADAYVDVVDTLKAATELNDLRAFRSWRLESLRGQRQGYHSIRLNQDWRVILRVDDHPDRVTIVQISKHDYRRR